MERPTTRHRSRERLPILPTAAVSLAAVALLAASMFHRSDAQEFPPAENIPTALELLADAPESFTPNDTCATNIEYLGEFSAPDPIPASTAVEIEQDLKDTYNVDVIFETAPLDAGDFHVLPYKTMDGSYKLRNLRILWDTLTYIDPRVIMYSEIQAFHFNGQMTSRESYREVDGLALSNQDYQNDIYLSSASTEEQMVLAIAHETDHPFRWHTCNSSDLEVDAPLSRYSPLEYSWSNNNFELAIPGPDQSYVSVYAQKSVDEDGPETFANLIAYGPSIPGSANFGSKAYYKELEELRRRELATPGFTQNLLDRTYDTANK